jgi:hypothetical protein
MEGFETMTLPPKRKVTTADLSARGVRLAKRHRLARIFFVLRDGPAARRLVAKAFPDPTHPIVTRRMKAATAGLASVSLPELEKITEAAGDVIARGMGATFTEVLDDLERQLIAFDAAGQNETAP